MSVTGGPTANTEFEVLSRSSLLYFPSNSVPYTQYLKQKIPSIVETLKSQEIPYDTYAYHSYFSSGYNRNSVYNFMEFDNKVFEDAPSEIDSKKFFRDYLTDEYDYQKVISMYEEQNKKSNNPFFCFNVTIQNHRGYTGSYGFEEPVTVTNFEATEAINNYVSLLNMSDKAFETLIDYFSSVEEPTIILMYGDHQPSWDEDSAAILTEHPLYEDATTQALSKYYVPYIIWANYDINNSDDNNVENSSLLNQLSTNYLCSYLLQYTGLEFSDYDKFLLKMHEEYPAITALGYWTNDGKYHVYDATNAPQKLKELEMIQYNLLFDSDDKLWDKFQ